MIAYKPNKPAMYSIPMQTQIAIQDSQMHPRTYHQLMKQLGESDALIGQSDQFYQTLNIPEAVTERLRKPRQHHIDRTMRWLEGPDRHLIDHHDSRYPRQLKDLPCHPPLLAVLGDPLALQRPSIGVVGSRNASFYGLYTTESLVKKLATAGICIVSGLAIGIDAKAHQTCVENHGTTVAVIGMGMDHITPSCNLALAAAIRHHGCIVSEMPLGTRYHKQCFPRRNRIISGLSNALLIPEAQINSGSLITAKYAIELHRPVMAVPGQIHQPQAAGCHQLIQEGAHLVSCATDCLDIINNESIKIDL